MDLWFTGDSAEETLGLMSEACDRIATFSPEAYSRELGILRAEGAPIWHPLNRGLALRYGASGAGTVGFPQLGLGWLEPDDVEVWASRFLCADNAAVWANFEIPNDFRLGLPRGELNVRAQPVP
jgi:hypothetical protein